MYSFNNFYSLFNFFERDNPAVVRAIAAFATEHQLPQFYTVELALEGGTQVTRDAVANHQRSREYVRTVFGV